jgi:hypothetical protein
MLPGGNSERTIMENTNDTSEPKALTFDQSASALGVHEFSLFSRIQGGDIAPTRLPSGIMAIPICELERLLHKPVNGLAISNEVVAIHFSDEQLGIKNEWGGLKRANGEPMNYSVPGFAFRFTESEMKGYRAAFGLIAKEYESLNRLKNQLKNPAAVAPSSEKEISALQPGVWQVHSTLLNLGQSNILLCRKQNEFAVIERFRADVPYAQANGRTEILLQRSNPHELASDFYANASHTLEFMASNHVATAQNVIWKQFSDCYPARVVEAISERCRLAVTNEETIAETRQVNQSNGRSIRIQ